MSRKPTSPRRRHSQQPDKPPPVAQQPVVKAPPMQPDNGPSSSKPTDVAAAEQALAESVMEGEGRSSGMRFWHALWSLRNLTSFLISCGFHVALIVLLSLIVAFMPARQSLTLVVTALRDDGASERDLDTARVIANDASDAMTRSSPTPLEASSDLELPLEDLLHGDAQPVVPIPDTTRSTRNDALLHVGHVSGGGFQGRAGDLKKQLLGQGGGTRESEDAVGLGLAWLAAHQWQDGGWRLDLADGPCGGRCRNSGKVATSTGATGLALLPFLGAGHTHLAGDYRDVVHRGLYYLKSRGIKTPHGLDLQEGTMYGHGIATLALCEAYAMTQDESLREPAQQAIDFICYAQHSEGGWRYYPNQPGDTTVFGWQMMSLKSAAMGGLNVPSPVVALGQRFLDSVQSANGAYYGYQIRGKKPGPTAVGLLIRMYTGWPHEDARLQRGVEFLANEGPAQRDMYFNYYATQVMHHYGGPLWPKWNVKMREHLIKTQATTGHERGSWFFIDQHGSQGGRLYTTAICTMILEVYYRHMPIYQDMAVEDDWW